MSEHVEIREATPSEWQDVRDIRLRALKDAPFAFASTYERESAFVEADWTGRLTSGSATFLARLRSVPVGTCAGLPVTEDTVELIAMWVDPGVRGRGVAAKLVDAVIDWALRRGADRVHLWVTSSNEPARRFYQRLGFRYTGERQPLPSEPDLPELGMARPVASGAAASP